ncbi:hypothetical protein [Catellatospora aurea]|uniref:hypothetical protein n=1 Tax=Catellatospora aurea TaxID=1337874 RepID=UPI0036710FC7
MATEIDLYDASVSSERAVKYWDPMPHVAVVLRSLPQHGLRPTRDEIFQGKWEERNWRNPPGPFYGAMTDNCWVGRLHAPRHVLYGDDIEYEQEFLYRQPRTVQELQDVIVAMQEDPWAGWACDGDAWWTPSLVRQWWRERGRLRDWITAKYREWSASDRADEREAANGLTDYVAYLDGDLASHLQAYMYFLDNGAGPALGDRLPAL